MPVRRGSTRGVSWYCDRGRGQGGGWSCSLDGRVVKVRRCRAMKVRPINGRCGPGACSAHSGGGGGLALLCRQLAGRSRGVTGAAASASAQRAVGQGSDGACVDRWAGPAVIQFAGSHAFRFTFDNRNSSWTQIIPYSRAVLISIQLNFSKTVLPSTVQ